MQNYNFKETTTKFIELNGFEELTKIQEATLKYAKKDYDIVAISKTGTGKTHSFLIPIMEKINPNLDEIQVLITVPTRELGMQLFENCKLMSKAMPGLRIKQIIGGQDSKRIKEGLNTTPHILIATPGKLKDMFDENVIRVDRIKMFIIDEADMTLEFGFLEDLDVIFSRIKKCQTMCFSATLAEGLKPFIKKYFENPKLIQIEDNKKMNPNIKHILVNAKHKDYDVALLDVLKGFTPYVCLIFANTREECSKTANTLKENGYKVLELHGGLESRERKQAMRKLMDKEFSYIVCSDVAARGIDIDGVSHVISLGLPQELEYFIHRAGRTGRAGKSGTCITIYKEEDAKSINSLKERGIKFENKAIKNGVWKDVKQKTGDRKTKADIREIEIAKSLKRKKEKVKPNYKKKRHQEVLKVQQKERRDFIRKKIKEERKERYKANQRAKYNNQ